MVTTLDELIRFVDSHDVGNEGPNVLAVSLDCKRLLVREQGVQFDANGNDALFAHDRWIAANISSARRWLGY